MTRTPRDDADVVATLSAVLDAHREQLACLSGVVGTGIGLAASPRAGEPAIVIQIFVSPASDMAPLRQTVRQIVGPYPVECVAMSLPRGEAGGTESEG
jgi:hypothetical protein